MDYFNDTDNASFHYASSASSEFEAYPFLDQASATEEGSVRAYPTLVDGWTMVEQPGSVVDLSTGLQDRTSLEPVAPATSNVTQADGYGQVSYFNQCWPTIDHSGFLSHDDTFASTVVSETSAAVPTPSSVPLDYWGTNQSGPSTSTFHIQNVQPSYQLGTGPARTGLIPTGRFRPYGMSRARANELGNAEAGPSTILPPPVPYVGLPTLRPSGGISETTADAENNQTIAEENKVPTSKRTKLPRGQGPPRRHRVRMQEDSIKLCEWVKRWKGLPELPSVNKALEVATEIIPTIRPVVNQEPRLLTGHGQRTAKCSKSANEEFERRNVERRLFQELSRYYQLRQCQSAWGRPSLLSHVVRDLEDFSPPPGPSNEPPP